MSGTRAIPLKDTHRSFGPLRILLRDHGQVEVHCAVDEDQGYSMRPCGEAVVGVGKGYTKAYTDSDRARYGEDLGDLLGPPRATTARSRAGGTTGCGDEQKHRAKSGHRKADPIVCEDLSATMKSAQDRHRDTLRRLNGWVKGGRAPSPRYLGAEVLC